MPKALLIGATGLVGSQILQQLLQDKAFDEVVIFVRRSTGVKNPKLTEHVVDFEKMSEWSHLIKGDAAFSAMGTTRKQAGTIENQRRVDYDYQANFAKACAASGVKAFALVSAAGANKNSAVPYSKMKGELEEYVISLGFKKLEILRPGLLLGHREKPRFGEVAFAPVMKLLAPVLGRYKPVEGSEVARRAIAAAKF